MRRLEHLLGIPRERLRVLARTAEAHYRPFPRRDPKRPDKKPRLIDNPDDALKQVQKRIERKILLTYPLPPTMLGGVKRKSTRHNAAFHVGQPVVVNLDIRSCFPSISPQMVRGTLLDRFGCSKEIAEVLTDLTTFRGYLPQGAPSSTPLANLVLLSLHEEVLALATARGIRFSQWVDDMTLSGPGAEELIPEVFSLAARRGLLLHPEKVQVMRAHQKPQVVTGVQVNGKVTATRKRYEELRRDIIAAGAAAREEACGDASLLGRVEYVRHLDPAKGVKLDTLMERVGLKRTA